MELNEDLYCVRVLISLEMLNQLLVAYSLSLVLDYLINIHEEY